MFDLPPQESCKQAFDRHESMISQLLDVSIRLWSAINLCFRHSKLYNPTEEFCELASPDFDPRHNLYSSGVWDQQIASPDPPSHIDTTSCRSLVLDAHSWHSKLSPFYFTELYERQNRLRDLARFSGYGIVQKIVEAVWTMKEEGMGVYEDWKDADGEGARACGELIDEGERLAERAEELLKAGIGGGEGNTIRRRRARGD